MPRTILFPVDRSKESSYAFDWGIKQVCRPDDRVVILTVLQPPATFPISPDVSMTTMYAQINESNEADARKLLAECMAIAEQHNLKAERRLFKGFPTDVIPAVAEEENADFIVVGAHEQGPVKRFFTGSVSDSVVHNGPCPVIVVKPRSDIKA